MASDSITNIERSDLAPTGMLRAGINFGNTVLVWKNAAGGAAGIAVDLANELARRSNLPLALVTFDSAGTMSNAVKTGAWDVAFLASEPERAHEIRFSDPYLEIDTTCVVRNDSSLRDTSETDRPGVRIVVSAGSAYDLYLSRTLRNAELVRAPSPSASAELFFASEFEALAGIRPMLEDLLRTHPESRLLNGRFTAVQQAIGIPRGRDAAAAFVQRFVDEIKRGGVLGEILKRNGLAGVAGAGEGV